MLNPILSILRYNYLVPSGELKLMRYPDNTPVCNLGLAVAINLSIEVRQGTIKPQDLINYAHSVREQFKNPNIAAEYSRIPLEKAYIAHQIGTLSLRGQLDDFIDPEGQVMTQGGVKTIKQLGYNDDTVNKILIEMGFEARPKKIPEHACRGATPGSGS